MARHGVIVRSNAGVFSCAAPNTATGSGCAPSSGTSGSVFAVFLSSTTDAPAAARAVSA